VERIGHYTIVSELGRGGMGVVYKAHEESLNRYVAIKVLGEHLQDDTEYVERFVREARSAAALSHPNIVQIYSIAEDQGTHYFAMEYVTGTNVQRMIQIQGKMAPADAVRIILQAAAGLEEAHSHGVIHRDIKPANLMVTEKGLVKIADFGLALIGGATNRLTATGMLMGTPGYLSPEQCLDQSPDHRTDIYSLGVTLFEMVTGRMPFRADSPLALLKLIVEVDPPDVGELNPDIDDELRSMIAKMLAKDRDERYSSCSEIIDDLQGWLQAHGEPPHPSTTAGATRGPSSVPPPPPSTMTDEEINTQPTVVVDSGVSSEPPTPSATPPATPVPTPPTPHATAPATQPPPPATRRRTGLLVVAVIAVVVLAGASLAAFLTVKSGVLDGILGDRAPRAAELGDEAARAHNATDEPTASVDRGATTEPIGEGAADDAQPALTAGSTSGPSAGRAEPSTDVPRPGGTGSGSTGSSRPEPAAGEPAAAAVTAPPTPVPTPEPTGTVVIAFGDRRLAVEAEEYVKARLRRGGVEVVEVTSIPGFEGFAAADRRPDPDAVRDALRPFARYLVAVRVDPLGEREVYFMGQRDLVHQSRISVNLVDLATGSAVGQRFTDTIEHTQLNVDEVVAETLRRPSTTLLQRLPRH
jgi:serine/threonine-protein kinase